jgi:hypothetical protein
MKTCHHRGGGDITRVFFDIFLIFPSMSSDIAAFLVLLQAFELAVKDD